MLEQVCDWENLLAAHARAARGKRGKAAATAFEYQLADQLIVLQQELQARRYRPSGNVHFLIHEPKTRKISAAPFRDRVVHHALCHVIAPVFERRFIGDSFANRKGKGTHRALDRLQQLARRYRYVLRMDIVQHFASVDHEILRKHLARVLADDSVVWLINAIIDSGDRVLEDRYRMVWFPGDDLLAAARPRGLPVGNLTSQFWSNCYLDPFDHFVKRELRCKGYLRYVDDFALFSDSKRELWRWKQAVIERLGALRLTVHESASQVLPVHCGIPWLGFVVYPGHRRVKGRKVRNAASALHERARAYRAGLISFAELDASVQGWVNHVRYGDTWGLRRKILGELRL